MKNTLIGYVANRAHHSELGGKSPGSMPPDAKNLSEEGVVIHPFRLVAEGRIKKERLVEVLTEGQYPTRALNENLADIDAALASIKTGIEEFKNLALDFGHFQTIGFIDKLKQLAANSLKSSFQKFTKPEYRATEYLDDGTPLSVAIKIRNEKIVFDFAGSGSVHPANLNANPSIVNSAVIYVLKLMVSNKIPLNEGLMEKVELQIPEGLLNPTFPKSDNECPAVVGGNTEVSQRLVDTLLKALGISACSQGTMNNLLFGNDKFGYYETIAGGVGATKESKGASAVHQHMTNTKITDPEILEVWYPVRLDEFKIRKKFRRKRKVRWWRGCGEKNYFFRIKLFDNIESASRK